VFSRNKCLVNYGRNTKKALKINENAQFDSQHVYYIYDIGLDLCTCRLCSYEQEETYTMVYNKMVLYSAHCCATCAARKTCTTDDV